MTLSMRDYIITSLPYLRRFWGVLCILKMAEVKVQTVKLTLSEQAQMHIRNKGGRVAVDLVCVST